MWEEGQKNWGVVGWVRNLRNRINGEKGKKCFIVLGLRTHGSEWFVCVGGGHLRRRVVVSKERGMFLLGAGCGVVG